VPVTARRTRPLGSEVAELLKRRILSGAHAPGQKLPAEVELAKELGVHRVTVREAMKQLEQLHLIERRAGAGTVVLPYGEHASVDVIEYLVLTPEGVVNIEVLANLLETARIMSSEIAALAAERRNDADLSELDMIVTRMRSEKNLSKLFWLDFDFNWTLAGSARNIVPRLLLNSVRGLLKKYTPYLETLWVSPGSITEGYEHVVEAVRARNAERARSLVLWIWTGRHQRFIESVERQKKTLPPERRTTSKQ
jgi:GntR family transcriptional repressor for pyruvate dehydrogenase complex